MNGLPTGGSNTGLDPKTDFALSYMQGQRLSRCTCPGESHPGPVHEDGTYVGRSAPEIDIFEAQVRRRGYGRGDLEYLILCGVGERRSADGQGEASRPSYFIYRIYGPPRRFPSPGSGQSVWAVSIL
jgi:hypothetical protein